jgi:hypothetical protein
VNIFSAFVDFFSLVLVFSSAAQGDAKVEANRSKKRKYQDALGKLAQDEKDIVIDIGSLFLFLYIVVFSLCLCAVDADREGYLKRCFELEKSMAEINSERIRLVNAFSPFQVRVALETIFYEFRDRHRYSHECTRSAQSLPSASAFYAHWLECPIVGYVDGDAKTRVYSIDDKVMAEATSEHMKARIPDIYSTLSSQVHSAVSSASLREETIFIPSSLTADQICALATILNRHHYPDIRCSDIHFS